MNLEDALGPDSNVAAPAEMPAVEVKPMGKPRIWTVFATWIAGAVAGQMLQIFAGVSVGLVIGISMGAQGADAAAITTAVQEFLARPLPGLLVTLVPFQLGMLAIVLLAARRSPSPTKERLGLTAPAGPQFSRLRLSLMASFTVSTALTSVIVLSLMLGMPPADTAISNVIASGSWWTVTFASLLLSLLPAVVEEVFFRGYIQRRLLQRWSPFTSIAVTTVLFALLHADSLQHILAVVPLSIVTGLLAYRTGSVKPGIVVHAVHNVAAVGLGAAFTGLAPSLGEQTLGMLVLGLLAALFLAGVPAVLALVRNRRATPVASAADPFAPFQQPAASRLLDSGLARQGA